MWDMIKNQGVRGGLYGAVFAAAVGVAPLASAQTLTIAEGDNLTNENLIQLIAIERARERGVDVELIAMRSDDIVFQAVLNGQVDIGIGTVYAPLQTLGDSSIRHFFQLRRAAFFPVVNTTVHTSWADLDGAPMAVHARGSTTEAMARYAEAAFGISYSDMTFMPGSEVRIVAMRRGTMNATFLDMQNTRLLLAEDSDRFALLPLGDVSTSDSVLFARMEVLEERRDDIQVLLEEKLRAAREINADPTLPARLRDEMGLMPNLPAESVAEITPYFETAVAADLFPANGGGRSAAMADLRFLTTAEVLSGNADELDVEQFWYFGLLEAALESLQ